MFILPSIDIDSFIAIFYCFFHFFKAEIASFPNNDMIQQSDIQKLPNILQSHGDRPIPGAWFRFAAGMVVKSDDGIYLLGRVDTPGRFFLDEAFSGLPDEVKKEIQDFVAYLKQKHKE